MTQPTLTVTVLTLNEEEKLARCLDSLQFAQEILVLDAGSTDRTPEIAARHNARFEVHPWSGFLEQRRRSLERATSDWVMYIDADEWITSELAAEIQQAIRNAPPELAGFVIDRKNWFLDQWMEYAWQPDRNVRLFRKQVGDFGGGEPHIHVVLPEGAPTQSLTQPLLHQAFDSVQQLVVKADRYSTMFAAADSTDHRFSWLRFFFSPWVAMLKMLILKRAFLDGIHGWIAAGSTGMYHFLKYAKKWQKLRGRRRETSTACARQGR